MQDGAGVGEDRELAIRVDDGMGVPLNSATGCNFPMILARFSYSSSLSHPLDPGYGPKLGHDDSHGANRPHDRVIGSCIGFGRMIELFTACCRPPLLQVNIPKQRKTFCPGKKCRKVCSFSFAWLALKPNAVAHPHHHGRGWERRR